MENTIMQAVHFCFLTRCTVNLSQAAVRAGAGTPPRIRSFSGDVYRQPLAAVESLSETETDRSFSLALQK